MEDISNTLHILCISESSMDRDFYGPWAHDRDRHSEYSKAKSILRRLTEKSNKMSKEEKTEKRKRSLKKETAELKRIKQESASKVLKYGCNSVDFFSNFLCLK